jgi:hypothetical protein
MWGLLGLSVNRFSQTWAEIGAHGKVAIDKTAILP